MEKICSACRWWQKQDDDMGSCIQHAFDTPSGPRPFWTTNDMSCPKWQENEPASYKPSNGPFWARKMAGHDGDVWETIAGDKPQAQLVSGLCARMLVDRDNAAVKEWLDEKAGSYCDYCQPLRWIPCSERWPEPDTRVLTCKFPIREGFWERVNVNRFICLDNSGCPVWSLTNERTITHWIPLPDPVVVKE